MSKRIMPFRDVPAKSVFVVLKERNRPTPAEGWFVKLSNSRSQQYSHAKEAIFALGDMVKVIAFPSERAAPRG